jgi:Tol biopolymer transport system component
VKLRAVERPGIGRSPRSPDPLRRRDRADGTDGRKVFSAAYHIALPAVSPNGKQIADERQFNTTTSNIEEVNVDGRAHRNLTPKVQGRADVAPSWSPDGRHLAFLSSRAGRYEGKPTNQLDDGYEMRANGRNVIKVIGYTGSKAGLDWLTWGR